MMAAHSARTRSGARRIRRLAYLSAGRAASSLATLVGREVRALEPRLCAASGLATADRGETGVIFEVEGSVRGLMALLLTRDGRDWLLDHLCPGAGTDSDAARSALREAGNIVASQAVSAMADHLGGRITISVPTLVEEQADRAFARCVDAHRDRSEGVAARTDLYEPGGVRRALLLFVPDAP
jgi:chemotaxis protein CheY-P-specific phosphatase CheC